MITLPPRQKFNGALLVLTRLRSEEVTRGVSQQKPKIQSTASISINTIQGTGIRSQNE